MANVKIISVENEKDFNNEILTQEIENSIQLFFIPLVSLNKSDEYDIGDVVKSNEFNDRYAIIAKEDIGVKMSENVILLGVYNLLEELNSNKEKDKSLTIIVSKTQFKTDREMFSFETAIKFVLKINKDFKNISEVFIIYTDTTINTKESKKSKRKQFMDAIKDDAISQGIKVDEI